MQHTIELIKKFFENMEWTYDFEDGDFFMLDIETASSIGHVQYGVFVKETEFTVAALIPNKPEPAALPRVAEYLLRANAVIPYSNFELDYDTREIRVAAYVDFELCSLSYAVVERALLSPLILIAAFGNGLLRAMYSNEDITKLIMEAEDSYLDD